MISLSELPRAPNDAFQFVLPILQEMALSFPKIDLAPRTRTEAIACIRMLQHISRRLANPDDYQEPLARALKSVESANPSGTKAILASVEELYIANTLDNHFIDAEDEERFNELDWQAADRDIVLSYLTDARKIISSSSDFDDHHTRRMLYWISKAENEAFAMKGKFATFLAATSEILDLADEAGEKGSKLASLVQKIRTTTRRNVSVEQIEVNEKPKQIAPPKD